MTIIPRHVWLKERIDELIHHLQEAQRLELWHTYMRIAKDLSKELLYAVTEWEKCYKDSENE